MAGMATAAERILERLDSQLHASQRNLRLYFGLGGGLLLLGLAYALDLGNAEYAQRAGNAWQYIIFLLGSLLGYLAGMAFPQLAMPVAVAHVRSLLIDGLLLVPLLDTPQQQVPSAPPRRSLLSAPASADSSMASRLDWIVNNWSIIMHRMGYRPLPPGLSRLHILYLALIIGVPAVAILTHNVMLLLALGSVYVLGIGLDALECDAVRQVLLDALRGEG